MKKYRTFVDKTNTGFVVEIELRNSERYIHKKEFEFEQEALSMQTKVILANEVNIKHWNYAGAKYGSMAWLNNGHERDQIQREYHEIN